MTIDDEELMQLFSRTSMQVRRAQRTGEEAHGHRDHGPRDRREPPPPPYDERGGHPGPPPPPPSGQGHRAQGRVLALLDMSEGLSQKDIAYMLGIRPQSLTETLMQLEESGFIERRRNPDDGRISNVYLTQRGRERAKQAAMSRRLGAQGAFASLDEHDKEELARILRKLSDALED